MNWMEVILVTGINALIWSGLTRRQRINLDQRIKLLRQEVLELEDLVAAIIAEFKEVAKIVPDQIVSSNDAVEFRFKPNQETPLIVKPVLNKEDNVLENLVELNNLKREKILALNQRGLQIEEIAKQIGTGIGEVKLFLGIYGKN